MVTDEIDRLYRDCADGLYRYLYGLCGSRESAQDILQETFLRVIRFGGSFEGKSSLKTWLYAIARNEYRRFAARAPREGPIPEDTAPAGSVEGDVIEREQLRAFRREVSRLDEERRSLLMLRLVDGLRFSEIAEILGRSESWARVCFLRERRKLAEKLEGLK